MVHTPKEGPYKVVQRIVKFQILDFCFFFSFVSVNTWG